MTHTELLTNQIKHHLDNNYYLTVDTFRDMYIDGLPGKLTFLAISRDGQKVLPIFDPGLQTMEKVDYTKVRTLLGTDWTPVISAHVWNRLPGNVPQTLLAVDGLINETLLHTIFGVLPRWNTVGAVHGFDFGCYDPKTLPPLAMFTVDRLGARRIRTMNPADEGKVRDVMLDTYGYVRYCEVETNKIVMARLDLDRVELDWHYSL